MFKVLDVKGEQHTLTIADFTISNTTNSVSKFTTGAATGNSTARITTSTIMRSDVTTACLLKEQRENTVNYISDVGFTDQFLIH